jgi:predicted ATP-dependent endonuclease of OLD family
MKINKIIVKNYKSLKDTKVDFKGNVSIIVGDNEVGKTSLLEAIHLGLSSQIDGRHVGYDLHPYLFNQDATADYLTALRQEKNPVLPSIVIELFFEAHDDLASLRGSINSLNEDTPGVKLSIEFDEKYAEEYAEYISDPSQVTAIPIEYLKVVWRSFTDHDITARSIPLKPIMIDASAIRHNLGASRYVIDVMSNYLSNSDRAKLALTYRKMKNKFLEEPSISSINDELEKKTGEVSDKKISIALDNTARAKWETGVMPHLDEIPFSAGW